MRLRYEYDDGGRKDAGFNNRGEVGDCVCRALAIATGRPYAEIYDRLAVGNETQRLTKRSRRRASAGQRTASHGILTGRKWFRDYMTELGFEWTATMQVGVGCKVHLRRDELPDGRLVCNVSKHLVAVIDGCIRDTYNPDRLGTRCVYGYWRLERNLEIVPRGDSTLSV